MNRSEKKGRIQKAVALKYIPAKDTAPKVTAKGSGRIAEKILELARKHGIPIREDRALVEVLSRLEIDQEIPVSLYAVVAEILAFVYSMSKKWDEHRERR